MRRRFVRTIVGLGIVAASAAAVVAGAPEEGGTRTPISRASTSLPIPFTSRLWATILGLATAGAAVATVAQRRQRELDVTRKG